MMDVARGLTESVVHAEPPRSSFSLYKHCNEIIIEPRNVYQLKNLRKGYELVTGRIFPIFSSSQADKYFSSFFDGVEKTSSFALLQIRSMRSF